MTAIAQILISTVNGDLLVELLEAGVICVNHEGLMKTLVCAIGIRSSVDVRFKRRVNSSAKVRKMVVRLASDQGILGSYVGLLSSNNIKKGSILSVKKHT